MYFPHIIYTKYKVRFLVKLQENKNRWFVTIPKEYVKLKKWKKGQELALGFDHNGNIVIKEV